MSELDGMPSVLTVPEVAAVLRCGKNQAYRLVADGSLYGCRIGRALRVPRASLEEFLGQGQSVATRPAGDK